MALDFKIFQEASDLLDPDLLCSLTWGCLFVPGVPDLHFEKTFCKSLCSTDITVSESLYKQCEVTAHFFTWQNPLIKKMKKDNY